MAEPTISEIQKALNAFTSKYLRGVTPLVVDGKKGKLTNTRIRTAKFYVGYGDKRDSKVTDLFLHRIRHPHSSHKTPRSLLVTGARRRARQRARWAGLQFRATVSPNVTRFDGVPCAIWLAKKLQAARNAGRWKGRLVSGWRSPAYSESLCRAMCGAPRCPGRCAGRSSNHSGSVYPAGAVDVSDYETFAAEAKRLGLGIHNSLGAQDPVHFSVSGV